MVLQEVFNSGGAGYVINAPALELLAEGINTRQKCRPNQVRRASEPIVISTLFLHAPS